MRERKKEPPTISETKTEEFCERWVVTFVVNEQKKRISLFAKNKNAGFGVRKFFRDKYPMVYIDSVRYQ
jgi:hypothetical protein